MSLCARQGQTNDARAKALTCAAAVLCACAVRAVTARRVAVTAVRAPVLSAVLAVDLLEAERWTGGRVEP